ncbi:MAG: late competence development ComFB family protein [Oscillospiraceae bacterium]|nr:late competence development ComFB family protein [Oscillospiraceae bacterium]
MTNTRRTKRNINKELMFSKIMPTYSTNAFNEYYQNGTETRGPKGSEPDTFKIREKVLDALKDRVPMQDDEMDLPPVRNSEPDFPNGTYRQAYQNYHQNRDQIQQSQPYQSTRVFPVQTQMQYTQEVPVQREIPAPVQAAPAPVSTDDPRYINVTEEVLYSKLTEMIAKFKCCNCEKCRQHIMLHVLNNVKPEYVYKKPSEVKELIANNNYVDINQPIIRAILETKANPPHKK